MRIAVTLLFSILAAPLALAGELPRSSVSDKDLAKLGKHIETYFEAMTVDARADAQEAVEDLADDVAKLEKRARLDEPLLAFPGDWDLVFDAAKPEVRELRAGRGFIAHYFEDPWDDDPVRYLIRLPDDYGKSETPLPALVALKPTLGLEGSELEERVLEMAETMYEGLEDWIILVPLGRASDPERPERDGAVEHEGGWMTNDGLFVMFSAFRVLLEHLSFDRSRVVIDGWGEAGLDAVQIGANYPSWWSGVINRSGEASGPMIIFDNMGGSRLLYVDGAEDGASDEAVATVEAADSEACPVTVVSEPGSALAPSEETRAAIAGWLAECRRDLAPASIDYRVGDIRFQSIAWLQAGDVRRRAASRPDDEDFPRMTATIDRSSNTIDIQTVSVFELVVYLSDALVDLDEEVTIKVNGETRVKETFDRSLDELLDNRFYNYSGDYGIYCATARIENLGE